MIFLLILMTSVVVSTSAMIGGHYWRRQRFGGAAVFSGRSLFSAAYEARAGLLTLLGAALLVTLAFSQFGLFGAHR